MDIILSIIPVMSLDFPLYYNAYSNQVRLNSVHRQSRPQYLLLVRRAALLLRFFIGAHRVCRLVKGLAPMLAMRCLHVLLYVVFAG